jgi:hypothetical protein
MNWRMRLLVLIAAPCLSAGIVGALLPNPGAWDSDCNCAIVHDPGNKPLQR